MTLLEFFNGLRGHNTSRETAYAMTPSRRPAETRKVANIRSEKLQP
jgi:hypothetical protein